MTIQEKISQAKNDRSDDSKDSVIVTLLVKRKRMLKEGRKIRQPEDTVPCLRFIKNKKQEYFVCITLSGSHEIIAIRTITIGLANSCNIHPREVFADAITDRAVSIIVAHNHPSGSLELSDQDHNITKRLKESAKLLGINFLDHLVISKSGFKSIETGFEDENFFKKKAEPAKYRISKRKFQKLIAELTHKYEKSQKSYETSSSIYEPAGAVAGGVYEEAIRILQGTAGEKNALTEPELNEVIMKLNDMEEHYSHEASVSYDAEDQFSILNSNYYSAQADVCKEVIGMLKNFI